MNDDNCKTCLCIKCKYKGTAKCLMLEQCSICKSDSDVAYVKWCKIKMESTITIK